MKRPITTINPRIGDESFVATFGRLPTPDDDVRTRVATHVGYVARLLRQRDASHLPPAARVRRGELLDALDAYVAAGAFPGSETDHGLLPTFLDPHTGVRCAVAHLVETTAGTALMTALDRDHHNDYIDDLADDPRFVAWTEGSGLSHEELAWIQPSYPPPPPANIQYQLAAEARVAVARPDAPDAAARSVTPAGPPGAIGLVDGMLRYTARDDRHPYGRPSVELDGAVGITGDEHAAYAVAARLGTSVDLGPWRAGVDAGVAVDAYGPSVPRAWTLPVDVGYHYMRGHHPFGIHAGPRFALDGARDLGWNVGLDLHRLDLFGHTGRFAPRDLVVSLDATHVAGATYVGITLGVGNPRARWWWEE